MTESTEDYLESSFTGIRRIVTELRAERDLYRAGLQAIIAKSLEIEDAKLLAHLFLGHVVVTMGVSHETTS
jgi:hypothetical protein